MVWWEVLGLLLGEAGWVVWGCLGELELVGCVVWGPIICVLLGLAFKGWRGIRRGCGTQRARGCQTRWGDRHAAAIVRVGWSEAVVLLCVVGLWNRRGAGLLLVGC